MRILTTFLLLGIATVLAGACGGGGADGGSDDPTADLPLLYTPYLAANELWSRTESDSLADQGTWSALALPTPPTGAATAVLGLRGRARGASGTNRSRVWLDIRSPGADVPAHHTIRLNAQDDEVDVKQQNLCFVPLGTGNTIEVWYELEMSGGTNDQARASIFLQGWMGGCGPFFSPLDPGHELFSRTETSDLSDEDEWIPVPLAGVPGDAKAVALNLTARAAGVGAVRTSTSLFVRAEGSLLEPGDLQSTIGVAAHSVAVNRNRNCVLVPLTSASDAVEFRYRMQEGGSPEDQFRVHVHVQGYVTEGCGSLDIETPYQTGRELLRRELSTPNPDAGPWQTLDLSSVVPPEARGVLLGLVGSATGRVGGNATQIRLRVRRPGDPEPAHASLSVNAIETAGTEWGHNLVWCPLSSEGVLEYQYQLAAAGAPGDAATFGIYLQGFVGAP